MHFLVDRRWENVSVTEDAIMETVRQDGPGNEEGQTLELL